MRFNRHSELQGKHALLSPSYYHWVNYDQQKLEARYYSFMSANRGTELHALAHQAIKLGIPLDPSNEALAMYVNDAIAFGMSSEQPLYYSDNCFGTADSIGFYDPLLRVHDLKNGINATNPKQLEVYAALFCLEYARDPFSMEFELRIYQRNEVRVFEPPPEAISSIMDKIIEFDQHIESLKEDDRW